MTPNEIKTGNILIAEFIGYKLAKCSNGLAWESPFRYAVEDHLKIHGVLLDRSYSKLKFHSDWNQLIPIIADLRCKMSISADDKEHLLHSMLSNDIGLAFFLTVKNLQLYNP